MRALVASEIIPPSWLPGSAPFRGWVARMMLALSDWLWDTALDIDPQQLKDAIESHPSGQGRPQIHLVK